MSNNKYLYCPIRGTLKLTEKNNKNEFTEEFRRIELVKFLLNKGYPKELFDFEKVILKYGNSGRNTLQADLVIFRNSNKDDINNISIVCEVKKNSNNKESAIKYQLKPAFDNIKNCEYAIYWDDEHKILFRNENNIFKEISILKLAPFRANFQDNHINYSNLIEIKHPLKLLKMMEQKIHNQGATNKNYRYEEIFKIFLLKYFDEHKNRINDFLEFQIFGGENLVDFNKRLQNLYKNALEYYRTNAPIQLDNELKISDSILKSCVEILQDYSFTKTNQLVLQDFYMYFAPTLLTKELDQYYTPKELVNFITEIIQIDSVKTFIDPCGGSGDFVVSLIKKGINQELENVKENAYYFDISQDAVNIASLNMILNGDGRSNIEHIDSIESNDKKNEHFDICVTNPPFGDKTIWSGDINKMKSYKIAKKGNDFIARPLGVLFIERCINLLKKDGILAIVLPNGYLTNPSHRYVRDYLLKEGRIIGCISLPEDVFKKSDASGFTDILIFQKTITSINYRIFSGVANKIGFEQTRKNTPPIYKMTDDGDFILKDNRKVIYNDLINIANEFKQFAYDEGLLGFEKEDSNTEYSSFHKEKIESDKNKIISARRTHKNYTDIINTIKKTDFKTLSKINADVSNKKDCHIQKDKNYIYLDTGELFNGQYRRANVLKGWELPNRAKLSVQKNDILISKTKGCFNKFCMIVEESPNIIATNGFYRVRIKDENERLNFFSFCFTKNYIVQMEALTTGTVLADIKVWDLKDNLYIPKSTNLKYVKMLIEGFENLCKL